MSLKNEYSLKELYIGLGEIYFKAKSNGFVEKTKNQELYLKQMLVDSTEEPSEEHIFLIRDILEVNTDLLYDLIIEERSDAEEAYTRACIKKYYGDINYIIEELI